MTDHQNTRRSVLLAGLGAIAASKPAPESKPNIVLIFADDMGWKDGGYTGSDFYETPNIDALAKQGMDFAQAYACGANCVPSRARAAGTRSHLSHQAGERDSQGRLAAPPLP